MLVYRGRGWGVGQGVNVGFTRGNKEKQAGGETGREIAITSPLMPPNKDSSEIFVNQMIFYQLLSMNVNVLFLLFLLFFFFTTTGVPGGSFGRGSDF